MDCIFCKIINKEIPGKIVYEDDVCLAFLDLSQVTDGHTLIVPKSHFDNLLEADDEVIAHMLKVAKKLGNQLVEKLNAKGMNVLTNINETAGQTVKHFHIHLIPRYNEKEGIQITFEDRSSQVSLDEIYDKIMK
jgi:Diadenosine tetraphosphate (Ap4A) hydrolase and other HIT family hydrolases